MSVLRFSVPGAPRGKGRPRFASTPRGGRTYTDAQTASYENLVKLCARQAGAQIIDGPVEMWVAVYLSIPQSASKKRKAAMLGGAELPTKKPDLTNVVKSIEDALNLIAYRDDSAIVSMHITKHYADEPRVDVVIAALEAPAMRASA
jgi:Holliday junction resolvase RusA-like endonuclease